ncbi:MAG: hypothetical protein DI563_01120 [Variovorax paradoxus]|jgi:hypothetical protein|uniref:Uncharacterized protein n=1 Tax=Variovorax paradoxus TaxID=34073 RepID=A0A2W5QLJ3_VARPD|nr:MAG: hypothetical protein DI563_01120 [Variovorax paradoxus]
MTNPSHRIGAAVVLAAASLIPPLALAQGDAAHSHAAAPTERAPATSASVAATTTAVEAAPEVNLRVTHVSRSIGVDGVERESRYTNRVFRRTAMVWTERELPEGLRKSLDHGHSHAHGPHAGHAHDEAQGAPLRVTRDRDGKETVEVVLAKTRRVIEVDRAHHGNVGYGGSWDAAYWLISPASLQRMERVGAPKGGVQRYTLTQSENRMLVEWDVAGQFPRKIERSDAHGTSFYQLTATRLAKPDPAPWEASRGYARGDYSDLLD